MSVVVGPVEITGNFVVPACADRAFDADNPSQACRLVGVDARKLKEAISGSDGYVERIVRIGCHYVAGNRLGIKH